MELKEVIHRIQIGDRTIKGDLWVIVDEYIDDHISTYFNVRDFVNPNRIVRWVDVFVKLVHENKVQATSQEVGAYFWEWKQKRITNELLKFIKRHSA